MTIIKNFLILHFCFLLVNFCLTVLPWLYKRFPTFFFKCKIKILLMFFSTYSRFHNWHKCLCWQNSSNTRLWQLCSLKSLSTVQAKENLSHYDGNGQKKLWHISFKIPRHFPIIIHKVAQDAWIWHFILLRSKTKEHLINLAFSYSSITV
jgi:hypothetical protein